MVDKEFSMPHILSVRGVILVVEDRLTEIDAADRYERSFQDGSWVKSCSGKEVYNSICQAMFQDVAHKRDDFAKAIAEAQKSDDRIPDDLVELHDILHGVQDDLHGVI